LIVIMADRMRAKVLPPILDHKHHTEPPVFRPENLLREARRQRRLPSLPVPELCILDPDGDIVRALRTDGRGRAFPGWACYHTEMVTFELVGEQVGIVGCAVGASFAVLIAEQMFASGCRLLLSITSAGRIAPNLPEQAFFVLIERALRDEGTSYHYAPPDQCFADADPKLAALAAHALVSTGLTVLRGAVWTTDAPFRETAKAIAAAAEDGLIAVEMEAAALYAFARARQVPVLCMAHVTNRMAQVEGDFEKGEADGSKDALAVLSSILLAWRKQSAWSNPSTVQSQDPETIS
jgi:uridine phosphorylase